MSIHDSYDVTDADRDLFDAIQGNERVCAKCLLPIVEERDAPSERWIEARDRERTRVRDPTAGPEASRSERAPSVGTSTEAIAGFRSPDVRRTGTDAETWHCGYCGATDTNTPYPSGYSPTTEETLDILRNFVHSLLALSVDRDYDGPMPAGINLWAMQAWGRSLKQDRNHTNEPLYELVPKMVSVGRVPESEIEERADFREHAFGEDWPEDGRPVVFSTGDDHEFPAEGVSAADVASTVEVLETDVFSDRLEYQPLSVPVSMGERIARSIRERRAESMRSISESLRRSLLSGWNFD
jgi:hypothetical protein